MSDAPKTPAPNKNTIILAVLAAAVIIGGYIYMQKKDEKTATLNIGGKTISATVTD